MKRYNVIISNKAYKDMEKIHNYIAETLLSPDAAINQYNRIADAILTLEEMPERIKPMDSVLGRSNEMRPLIIDHYTVF